MPTAIGPQMQSLLQRYGLGELTEWLSERIIRNIDEEQLMLELYDHPVFKRIYPEIEARRAKAEADGIVMTPISVDDVMNYRTQARSLMRSYGLPPSFYSDNAAFFDLIVNDVSVDELNTRLETVSQRVANAPVEVRQVWDQLTGGFGDQAMYAFFTDPDKALPELENMVQQAEAGGAAQRLGFQLTPEQMWRMQGTNLSYNQMLEGFTLLDETRSLYDESLFEEENDFTVGEEGLEAAFALEGGAAAKIANRAETRTASTKGQAGGLIEQRGPTGLGGSGRR